MNCARIQHSSIVVAVLSALVAGLSSCDYRALYLEIEEDSSRDIWVSVDWSGFKQETPTGMSLYFYPKDNPQATPLQYLTNNISGMMVHLPQGRYDVLVFNQSVDEFGSMHFTGMDRFDTATAVLEEHATSWDVVSNGQKIGYEPEWLAVDSCEDFDTDKSESLSLIPQNVIYSAKANIRIIGADNIRSIRGSVTGLAEGFLLSRGTRTTVPATHILEKWSLSHDEDDYSKGSAFTSFRTFSTPGNDGSVSAEDVTFNVSFLLMDKKTISNYKIPVGDRIETDAKERTLTITIDGTAEGTLIDLPDIAPEDGDGFTVSVDDWGNLQVIDVPIL